MPFSATSSSPFLFASAPVNAPRMWPNSSDSSSVSGIAPQLSATNGLLAPQRVEVDRLRDQPLAGARLAGEQHRAVGARDRLDHLEHVEHRLAAPDDVRELVRRGRASASAGRSPAAAGGCSSLLAHLHLQLVDVERLAQVVARAEPHRLDRGVGRGERGDHDAEDVADRSAWRRAARRRRSCRAS